MVKLKKLQTRFSYPSKRQKVNLGIALGLILLLILVGYFVYNQKFQAEEENSGEILISNITNNGTDYPNSSEGSPQIPRYEKMELTFNLDWYHNRDFINPSAKYNRIDDGTVNPYWPYDPAPSANTPENIQSRGDGQDPIPAGKGITVNGIFTSPSGQTVTQPGFYFQDYEVDFKTDPVIWQGSNWLYPKDSPKWKIRFAPTEIGVWGYRFRVEDTTGVTTFQPPAGNFQSTASANPGFVKVSETDSRYFETSKDNQYLNLVGLETLELPDGTNYNKINQTDQAFSQLEENGVNLIRPWWSGVEPTIFSWGGQNGNIWQVPEASTTEVKPGRQITAKTDSDPNHSTMRIGVQPNRTYQVSASVKATGLTSIGSGGVGISIYPRQAQEINPLTEPLEGSFDWTTINGRFSTTASQYFTKININTFNTIGGSAYFTDVSVREDLTPADPNDDQFGPELIDIPHFDTYLYQNQISGKYFDRMLDLAHKHNIYIKTPIENRGDPTYRRIRDNGTLGTGYPDGSFYAWDPTQAGLVYQNYFRRYLIARYGYSTSIHSLELENESSPTNENACKSTQAMAKFFTNNDPNKHLITDSYQYDFVSSCWAGADYPNISYADWHEYIGQKDADDLYKPWRMGWSNALRRERISLSSINIEKLLDSTIYKSAPLSLQINNAFAPDDPAGEDKEYSLFSKPIAVSPGANYLLKWQVKGDNLHQVANETFQGFYPTLRLYYLENWQSPTSSWVDPQSPFNKNTTPSSFDWTEGSYKATIPQNVHYIILAPSNNGLKGPLWFDDITIFNETSQKYVDFQNGNFDKPRLDEDTALVSSSMGVQVGYDTSRQVRKPVMDSNFDILAEQKYSNPYKGHPFFSDQDLFNDTEGVWFRKYLFSHLDQYGIYPMYYKGEDVLSTEAKKYAKAYRNFTNGLDLSNGKYVPADATISNNELRVVGQKEKDPQSNKSKKAHLWIDNINSAWKNVINNVPISPVTAMVTIPEMENGQYNLEWWNTSTGTKIKDDIIIVTDNNFNISVENLTSDIGVKLFSAQAPTPTPIPTQTVTQNPTSTPAPTSTLSPKTNSPSPLITARPQPSASVIKPTPTATNIIDKTVITQYQTKKKEILGALTRAKTKIKNTFKKAGVKIRTFKKSIIKIYKKN